jgi:hypothetical protein
MTLNHKNSTIFPFILREIDAEETHFQPTKTQKMTVTLEVGIKNFRLFMKNK